MTINLTDRVVTFVASAVAFGLTFVAAVAILNGVGWVLNRYGIKVQRRVGLSFLALTFVGAGLVGTHLRDWTKAELLAGQSSVQRTALGTIWLISASVLMFVVKRHFLRFYALIEIAFGVVVAIDTMTQLKDVIGALEVLKIMASMYLLTGGFENYMDARKAARAKEKPSEEG